MGRQIAARTPKAAALLFAQRYARDRGVQFLMFIANEMHLRYSSSRLYEAIVGYNTSRPENLLLRVIRGPGMPPRTYYVGTLKFKSAAHRKRLLERHQH